MSEKYFEKALADFTLDFAAGGAIRVMADKGYTVRQIKEKLDFPMPIDKVRELVWKHYLDTGVILSEEPKKKTAAGKRVKYEKVQDNYGRTSFKQVVTEENISQNNTLCEYVSCDFGKQIYQNRKAFEENLNLLADDDRDYILGLPWPLQTVWHIRNERMERIEKALGTVPVKVMGTVPGKRTGDCPRDREKLNEK